MRLRTLIISSLVSHPNARIYSQGIAARLSDAASTYARSAYTSVAVVRLSFRIQ